MEKEKGRERGVIMTVRDIIEKYLKENKYDGLFNSDNECSCNLSDLIPCGCNDDFMECEPGCFQDCKECQYKDENNKCIYDFEKCIGEKKGGY